MGKRKSSLADDNTAKNREYSWQMIFKTLANLVQDQQRKIESFVSERKTLEKRMQSMHDRWALYVKQLEDHIDQMTRDSKIKDMIYYVKAAKANLIISMEQKKAVMHKLKFEGVDDERVDLKHLFDELSRSYSADPKDIQDPALKAERDFAWNQFKKTDNELQELRKRTKSEVEAANSKVNKLIHDLEESQLSNLDKNKTISSLQDNITVLESDSRRKSEEISRLTKELELLKSGSNRSITPALRRCMNASTSHSSDTDSSEKGVRSSKRKANETEPPRLFTSNFKVPKLKG
ncbi:uncharacterized protein [Rutidosis leptorrhynchoides]|uniref:uncharacterized protein n=1 Tax=Rutidosis leptorrhynchoides TaxID=125765 RepID=UPI003A993B84